VKDFRYNADPAEEIVSTGSPGLGFAVDNEIVMPYAIDLTSDEQKRRWLVGPPLVVAFAGKANGHSLGVDNCSNNIISLIS
jgi:hypothetical protein